MVELICKILHIGKSTYYKYKKDNYPIIEFLNSFDKQDLEELLITGKINKIELLKKCFSKEDLEFFLKTGEIPYKIQFANKYFLKLNDEFTEYILSNKGAKALMVTIINDTNLNVNYIYDSIIKQYDEKKINSTDLSAFIKNPISNELLLYILDNQKENWKPYLSSLEENNIWLFSYLEVLELSIKENCYEKIFHEYLGAVPNITISFYNSIKNNTKKDEEIKSILNNILLNVKMAIINHSIDELDTYNRSTGITKLTKVEKDDGSNIKVKDVKKFINSLGLLEIPCQSDKIISRIDNGRTNRI